MRAMPAASSFFIWSSGEARKKPPVTTLGQSMCGSGAGAAMRTDVSTSMKPRSSKKRRTAPIIEQLVADGYADTIREKTGLVPDAYFAGSKIKWLLDELNLRERAKKARFRRKRWIW